LTDSIARMWGQGAAANIVGLLQRVARIRKSLPMLYAFICLL
jgi:hypothetical protein